MEERERGLSTASLALLFLLGVLVCAVFFSFGFLVGYRERSSSNAAEVERVTPTGDAPPAVNAPPEKLETVVRQDGAPMSLGPAGQPAEAGLDQKGGNVASGTKVSAPEGGARGAPAAAEAMPAVPSHASLNEAAPVRARQAATGSGALQVAALQNRQDAETLVKVLKERGYPVFVLSPEDARANDKLFRVQVGPFESREEEAKTRQKLETEGFKPFVKR